MEPRIRFQVRFFKKNISVPPKNCEVLKYFFAKIRHDSGLVF
jgi:hypothetical protein